MTPLKVSGSCDTAACCDSHILAAASAAYQLKEACVRQMAAGIQSAVKEDAMKQHLLSLTNLQHHNQQEEERLEQALAQYKQLKEGHNSDDPGNVLHGQAWQRFNFF
jgi:hypothetical protein